MQVFTLFCTEACACPQTSRRRFAEKHGSSCLKLTDVNFRILYIRLAKNAKKCYNRYGNYTRAKDLHKEVKMIKTSIRFFDNIPVRAVWDDETSKWWFCAVDIAEALTGSKSPRKYWNTIKTRNPQLSSICRQLKLMAIFNPECFNIQNCPRQAVGDNSYKKTKTNPLSRFDVDHIGF